jgi:hypothetical protein
MARASLRSLLTPNFPHNGGQVGVSSFPEIQIRLGVGGRWVNFQCRLTNILARGIDRCKSYCIIRYLLNIGECTKKIR